jgi:glycosyltransferase involved in cell wall biosynthesis
VPRRILLLTTDLEIGGTPTVVRELATRLRDAANAHIEVVALSPPGPLRDQLFARNIKCTALGARGIRDFPLVIRRLHRLLTQESIDTVLSFLIHANTIAAATRPLYPGARYFQSIQTTQAHPKWHWSLQRLVSRAAEKIIVPSPSVATAAQQRSHIPPEKLIVILNAIDLADYPTGGTGVSPVNSPTKIGFIGRLDPIKRIPDLLQALSYLPAHHLHIYGEGPERASIESTISSLDLTPRVTLHGQIPTPQPALANIDLLVLPSDAEGFGLVLIEAMAARIPVVTTNAPGIRDVIRPNETGLLVPPRNPQALARAIQELTTNPSLREALITNAAEDVRQRFTWDAVLPQYLRLLKLNSKP